MNFKKYHESKNLWSYLHNGSTQVGVTITYSNNTLKFSGLCTTSYNFETSKVFDAGTYTIKANANRIPISDENACIQLLSQDLTNSASVKNKVATTGIASITLSEQTTLKLRIRVQSGVNYDGFEIKPMMNTGWNSLPYEPYSSEVWHDIPYYVRGTDTDTLTLPADIYADGSNATVNLKGNEEHTGTPSPSSPVDVVGVGERTAQLWDEQYLNGYYNSSDTFTSADNQICTKNKILVKPNTVYWLGVNFSQSGFMAILKYDSNGGFIERITTSYYTGQGMLYTTDSNTYFIKINFSTYYGTTYYDDIMIAESQTPLPYEPYGYKIPILSNSTTYNKYLGEEQTVRLIKKYEFTGQEEWSISNNERVLYTALADHLTSNELICYCSHYKSIANVSAMSALSNGECAFNNTLRWFYIKDDNYNDAATFKTYLQQQYSNGAPVTVWYVLATSTTGTVNEPLMKVGNYSDSLSTSIATTDGANNLSVGTTVQPSEVTANYHGWHPVQSVHEKSKNLFDKDNFTFGDSTSILYVPIYVGEGTFTLSTDFPDNNTKDVFFLEGKATSGASSSYNGVASGAPRTRTSSDGYVTVATRYNSSRENPADYNYMLNEGSTAQPYEPYWN